MKLGYRWEGIEKDVREFFIKWEVWQGRTKNSQKQTYNHYIETTHPREMISDGFNPMIWLSMRIRVKRASERRIKDWKCRKRDKWWRNRIKIQR